MGTKQDQNAFMYWHDFTFADAQLRALPAGALWWEAGSLLCVSDLHLGKSERIARRFGGLLPPYESHETLIRLKELIDQLSPKIVISLGDSFDDLAAGAAMDDTLRAMISTMIAGRNWVWITGNHDPGPVDIAGSWQAEYEQGGLTFRHIAKEDAAPGEVSGHYHPKARLTGRARPCFCYDNARLILPAFGTYTGGMRASNPVIAALFQPDARAVMTGTKSTVIPLSAA